MSWQDPQSVFACPEPWDAGDERHFADVTSQRCWGCGRFVVASPYLATVRWAAKQFIIQEEPW